MSPIIRNLAAVAMALTMACGTDNGTQPPPAPPPPPGPAPVATVTLGAMPTLVVGGTARLEAVTKDAQGNALENRTITWNSTVTTVATIDATGRVTAVGAGNTVITATSEGKSAQGNLTVSLVPVAAVAVTPANLAVGVGRQKPLAAAAADEHGGPLPGRPVTWSSVDPSIATVDDQGMVTGVAAGTTKINALIEGKLGQADVAVSVIPVASVDVTPGTAALRIGKTTELAATAKDEAGEGLPGRTFIWTTADPSIATVNAATGVVTAVGLGKVLITATSEGKKGTAEITVAVAPVASVVIEPGNVTLELSKTQAYGVTLLDDEGEPVIDRNVTWTTSNPAAATVDANGVVTAVDVGKADITATSEGKSAKVEVTVFAPVASIALAPALDTLEAHEMVPLVATLKDAKGRNLIGRALTWTVSDEQIARRTVNGAGNSVLLGLDRGTVTVTATSEGISATMTRVVVIRYRSAALGTSHSCDIASGGIAWCWGQNGPDARLGDPVVGPDAFRSRPFLVPGGHQFVKLVSYGRHSCGLESNGKVYCWGNNGWGALGAGSNLPWSATPLEVSGGLTFTTITAGGDHACGIVTGGQAYCWGQNDWGQLGTNILGASSTPKPVAGNISFTAISAGSSFTCGVAVDGAAWCWGANSIGQLGDGGPISYGNVFQRAPIKVAGGLQFRSIGTGNQLTCALTVTNQSYCWGRNGGRFGDGNGGDASSPRPTAGGLVFRSLSVGFSHVCGVTMDDAVYCWGGNSNGQLGYVAVNGSTTPQRAAGTFLAAEVSAAGIASGSGAHTCAISRDRLTVMCWGRNDFGQLGNGTTTPGANANPTPTIVSQQKPHPTT